MIRMNADEDKKVIYPELSYALTGICFAIHNELGPYSKENQYADAIENKLKESRINFVREFRVGDTGNIVDFLVDGKIILELKAKRILTREDYYQLQRYLQYSNNKLGLLVNFRNKYIKPVRIVRIDTDNKVKFSK